MKTRFASFVKGLRFPCTHLRAVLVAIPTLWMSVSFSQDGASSMKTPAHIPSDATALARIMGAQRTSWRSDSSRRISERDERVGRDFDRCAGDLSRSPKAKTLSGSVTGLVWKPIGPSGITAGTSIWNGRIDSIAISPTNPSVIYIGATDGGIWKTIDAGATGLRLPTISRCLRLASPARSQSIPTTPTLSMSAHPPFLKSPALKARSSTPRSAF